MTHQPERRKKTRKRVLKGGKVFYNNYALSYDCTIRNESDTGMQLLIDPQVVLPKSFALLNRKDGTLADAHIVWQKPGILGIEFSTKMQDVRDFSKSDIRRMSIIATRG